MLCKCMDAPCSPMEKHQILSIFAGEPEACTMQCTVTPMASGTMPMQQAPTRSILHHLMHTASKNSTNPHFDSYYEIPAK